MEVIITPDDDWFEPPKKKNPLDEMPIATDNPRPEEEIADNYASRHDSSPDFEKLAEETVTMHEKMYRFATKDGKHTIGGGSELVK